MSFLNFNGGGIDWKNLIATAERSNSTSATYNRTFLQPSISLIAVPALLCVVASTVVNMVTGHNGNMSSSGQQGGRNQNPNQPGRGQRFNPQHQQANPRQFTGRVVNK